METSEHCQSSVRLIGVCCSPPKIDSRIESKRGKLPNRHCCTRSSGSSFSSISFVAALPVHGNFSIRLSVSILNIEILYFVRVNTNKKRFHMCVSVDAKGNSPHPKCTVYAHNWALTCGAWQCVIYLLYRNGAVRSNPIAMYLCAFVTLIFLYFAISIDADATVIADRQIAYWARILNCEHCFSVSTSEMQWISALKMM